ncbi:MAG: ABC transporter permease [Oscillospiraceae bacterium]|nr:ABC transporter permease [Oscillospiraceae bacterium]
MNRGSFKFLPYGFGIIAFTIIPILIITWFAFTDESRQFTFDNILKIKNYAGVLVRSLVFASISTLICLLIAYPFAYFMSRISENGQKMCIIIIMLPMWTNLLLRTYSWMTLLENNGLINNLLKLIGIGPFRMINTPCAVILGMVYDFLPFMILPIYTVMTKIDKSLIEAGNDLGANSMQTLRRIILPLSIPGVLSGVSMVFVPAVSTFVISRLLGGGSNVLIGDLIESQFVGSAYNPWFGSALSWVLMVVMLVIMAITRKFDKNETAGLLL